MGLRQWTRRLGKRLTLALAILARSITGDVRSLVRAAAFTLMSYNSDSLFICGLGKCVESGGLSAICVGRQGQRRSTAFSKRPPSPRMMKTRTTLTTTICHCATAQAAPRHAVTHTQAAVVSPWTWWPFSLRTITPAPKKPTPVTMPWITRLSSLPVTAWIDRTASAEPRQRTPSVRTPVDLPCKSRLSPSRNSYQSRGTKPKCNIESAHIWHNL